jgi:hypothetical protein
MTPARTSFLLSTPSLTHRVVLLPASLHAMAQVTKQTVEEKGSIEYTEVAEHVATTKLADQAEQTEHQEGLWTIIKRKPLILLIIAYANIGSFMYGFDNLALSIALSMPSFG